MTSNKALEKIRKEIIDSGRDTRYKIEAYNFIMMGLDFYRAKVGKKRHFTGQELAKGLVEFAAKQFGPVALTVLNNWGIKATDDFGCIVYNLIDIRMIHKQESDRLADFYDVVDLEEYLNSQDYYTVDREAIRTIKGA